MSENKSISCPICQSQDWQNVDRYRIKPANMCLCMKCGFITYPDRIANSEDLKEFYRAEYRQCPSAENVFTGQRKLHYHNEFLGDLFKQWKQEGKDPVVFDVGAAFGMLLKWVRDTFPKADVSGSELTLSFRRVAYHEHNLILSEEIDTSKQYDLITSYKVAEHIPYIDQDLKKYRDLLKPDGLLYISVPTWFNILHCFGTPGYALDGYFHTNHINVWTRNLFETLLRKSGFAVIKTNYVFYDATYLCKKSDEVMSAPELYENPIEVLDWLDKIHKASLLYDQGKMEEAVALWPNFPDVQIARYELKRNEWHKKGWPVIEKEFLGEVQKACPENSQIKMFCADLALRYSQWQTALGYIDQALKLKPNDPGGLIALGHCYRQMAETAADPADKVKFFREAREATKYLKHVSYQHNFECINWIFSDSARIPMPTEIKPTV